MSMFNLLRRGLGAAALAGAVLASLSLPALAAGKAETPDRQSWSFAGPFGQFDRGQLQRGFQVYKEVCAACHSLNRVRFRNLTEAGGPEFPIDQVRALAAEYKVGDLNESGERIERNARLSDAFPKVYPNEQAARAAQNGAYPPDLSIITYARTYFIGFPGFVTDVFSTYQEHGADYVKALLVGYTDPPHGKVVGDGLHYNKYFPGQLIAMPNMLSDGLVTYSDGSPQTVAQYSKDVVAFLHWAADPKMEERKRIGLQVMIFLIVFAGLLYFTKKRVWADVAH